MSGELTSYPGYDKYMRAIADTYPEEAIAQQAVAQIPWHHNTAE